MTDIDENHLHVVEREAGSEPFGCNGCCREGRPGERMIEYDDGEYWPTFCLECLLCAVSSLVLKAPHDFFPQRRRYNQP